MVLPNAEKQGDCIKQQLDQYDIQMGDIDYDGNADTLDVSVKVFGQTVHFPLSKSKLLQKTPIGT